MSRDIVDTSAPSDRLIVAARIEGELPDQLACVGGEDPDLAVGDQQLDRWVRLDAMRCAPGVLLLAFLASVLWPANALGVDGDGETTFWVPLPANHGLSAKLGADDDEIDLKIYKRGQQVIYFAHGKVTPKGIDVKFGRFGEFVVDYEPIRTLRTREPNRRCRGKPWTTTEGFFRGTIRFRGERDYVRIDATRAKGKLIHRPQWECDYLGARASGTGNTEKAEDEASLIAASRRGRIGFWAVGSREEGKRPSNAFFAFSQAVREGVGISRFTFAGSRSAGFEFDNSRGTALVDPPAPFAGSARYLRRPSARDRWSGSLTAPFLGLGRVRLAGPGFRARLRPELLGFE